ncbi:MAG: hypothetical protein JNM33_13685 [Rubrivivax sp.]|nr:hypothetical protein [Rubrivivax sp.]
MRIRARTLFATTVSATALSMAMSGSQAQTPPAGKSSNELYSEMKKFQSGAEGNGIMARHSMAYTDAQLRLLANWLSTQR